MFKKKSYLKIEILPDGKPFLEVNIDKNTNVKLFSKFVNGFIVRQYLDYLLESIIESAKKNQAQDIGEEICNNIIEFQSNIQIKTVNKNRRNPIIKPSQTMSQFSHGEDNE